MALAKSAASLSRLLSCLLLRLVVVVSDSSASPGHLEPSFFTQLVRIAGAPAALRRAAKVFSEQLWGSGTMEWWFVTLSEWSSIEHRNTNQKPLAKFRGNHFIGASPTSIVVAYPGHSTVNDRFQLGRSEGGTILGSSAVNSRTVP
ncbi:hypothetical protein C8F01DRAFT_1082893 [Mycena amicta]|nr:hypothetical protein C8F01DRAFT_1082893 [Mycena amicta]